jgi:hypothetical protein
MHLEDRHRVVGVAVADLAVAARDHRDGRKATRQVARQARGKPPPFDTPAAETRLTSKQPPERSLSSSRSMNTTSSGPLPGASVQKCRPALG